MNQEFTLENSSMNLYREFIIEHGVNLEPLLGVKEWGLNRFNALKLVSMLEETNTEVLGGDVIQEINGEYSYTYDNWSCESIETCIADSKNYITTYPEKENINYYYVLVIKD